MMQERLDVRFFKKYENNKNYSSHNSFFYKERTEIFTTEAFYTQIQAKPIFQKFQNSS